ncbi:MAG: hypothetical protein ABI746_12930 [Dermatophilaceae bacterium]
MPIEARDSKRAWRAQIQAMHTSITRLSSGLRINSAVDDANGLAIVEGLPGRRRWDGFDAGQSRKLYRGRPGARRRRDETVVGAHTRRARRLWGLHLGSHGGRRGRSH